MIPQMRVSIIAPDALIDDRAFIRIHNKAAKDALREEAIEHWKKRIPGHFRASARSKYGYKQRQPPYKAIKLRKFKSRTDLVRTGATRQAVTTTTPEIRLGGRAANPDGSSGQLKLTMTMRLPFGQAAQKAVAKKIRNLKRQKLPAQHTGPRGAGVTIDDMKSEIGRILADEVKQIIDGFRRRYGVLLNAALKNRPRIRKRIEDLPSRKAA